MHKLGIFSLILFNIFRHVVVVVYTCDVVARCSVLTVADLFAVTAECARWARDVAVEAGPTVGTNATTAG